MSNRYDEGGKGTDLRDQFRQEYTDQQNQIQSRKRSRSTWLIGLAIGVLLLFMIIGGSACSTYNSLTDKQVTVKQKWADVDTLLQSRADLIPNLVNTVRGYAKHEEKVFSDIAAARSRLLGAQTPDEKGEANAQLTSALGRLLVLTENYPDLKASEQFKMLQVQLEGTERRIAVARQDYNGVVADYNRTRQKFPTVLTASLLGFGPEQEFKADPGSRDAPKVDFDK
jgi:LemA protein